MNEKTSDLIVDPCNPNFAIDQHGILCKRVRVKRPSGPGMIDLGYIQQGERGGA